MAATQIPKDAPGLAALQNIGRGLAWLITQQPPASESGLTPQFPGTLDKPPQAVPRHPVDPNYPKEARNQVVPGAGSWGPETDQPTIGQGLESLLAVSRGAREKIRDAAMRKGTGFENTPAGKAVGTAVDIINPLPAGKTDVALQAIVPFAAVMKRSKNAFKEIAKFHVGVDWDDAKFINEKVTPQVMRMVTAANKAGIEQMDHIDAMAWIDDYVRRGVRDLDGKVWWGKPGELHDAIVQRITKEGARLPHSDMDVKRIFRLGGDEVDFNTGTMMDAAMNSLYEETMTRQAAPAVTRAATRAEPAPKLAGRPAPPVPTPKAPPKGSKDLMFLAKELKKANLSKMDDLERAQWAHKVARPGVRIPSKEAPDGFLYFHSKTGESHPDMIKRLMNLGHKKKSMEQIGYLNGKPVPLAKYKEARTAVDEAIAKAKK